MTRLLLAGGAICCLLQLAAPERALAVYRYKDGAGNACFTDDWRNIPAAFRASAEPPVPAASGVSVPQPPAMASAVPPAPVSQPPETQDPVPPASAGMPGWAKIAIYLGAVVAGLFLLAKVLRQIASPLLGRLILLACFLGVMTYGYKLYVDNMVDGYFAIKQKAIKLMDKALKREPPPLPPSEGQRQ